MTYQYSDGDIDLHYDYIFVQRCPEIFVKALNSMNIVKSINFQECYEKHGVCTIQTRSESPVETYEFDDFVEGMDAGQGKNYQITYIKTPDQDIKIINASISYETELDPEIPLRKYIRSWEREQQIKFADAYPELDPDEILDTLGVNVHKAWKINLPISSRIITRDIYLSQACEVLDLVTDDNTVLVADLHFEDNYLPEDVMLKPRGLINHASNVDSFKLPPEKGGEWISLQKIITTENSNIDISKVICKEQEGVPFGHHPLEFEI